MTAQATSARNMESEMKSECGMILDSCRVCGARDSALSLRQMFGAEPGCVAERILFCTGVQFTKEDDLPTQICEVCLNNLSVAHEFKTQCLLSDDTFRRLSLDNKIKTESPENYAYDGDMTGLYDDKVDEETTVNDEILEVLKRNNIRKTGRLKKGKGDGALEIKLIPKKTVKKRGPYNKTGKPKRMRKLKFSRLKCELCDLQFANKEESTAHRKVVHKDNENWICEICGKVFVHRASHYQHIRSHMPPQYACEQCDYKTWHKHDLVKHIRIHTGIKLYQCEFCTASFHTSSNLSGHIHRHHERVKRYACTMCDRQFYDRTRLNRHVDSHNDIKRYECDVCHSCFTRRCYWKKHMQRQHGVVIPAQRPGRQKVNILIGELSANSVTSALSRGMLETCVGEMAEVLS